MISSTKDDISTTRQPLLEIFEDFKVGQIMMIFQIRTLIFNMLFSKMEENEKPVFRNSKHTFSSLNKVKFYLVFVDHLFIIF